MLAVKQLWLRRAWVLERCCSRWIATARADVAQPAIGDRQGHLVKEIDALRGDGAEH
jgi:hypothetical protein